MKMTAVILAGGKGTRISSLYTDIPKPMIPVCGKPVLEWQIECLKENGIVDIVLIVGYLGEVIQEYFQDGSQWNIHIQYIHETQPLGTAGALYYLKEIKNDFFLLNGDIIFDVDLSRMAAFHHQKKADITLFAHPNNHPYDSSLLIRDNNDCVTQWQRSHSNTARNCVNAGIHILSPKIIQSIDKPEPKNLDRDIIANYLQTKQVYAYVSPEYVHDMGTPERYHAVCEDIRKGIPARKNLKNLQKAVFLDRDGTVTSGRGFITSPEQIILEDGVAEAVRKINQSGYLAVLITNQPVIARGECTLEELEQIHGRLEYLLGKQGAYLDDIFYCPHHPDRGFPKEVPKYKINCNCRKPKPGLLFRAAERYHIDLSASYMIGDHQRDIEAGRTAGCSSFLIDKNQASKNGIFLNLLDAVNQLL